MHTSDETGETVLCFPMKSMRNSRSLIYNSLQHAKQSLQHAKPTEGDDSISRLVNSFEHVPHSVSNSVPKIANVCVCEPWAEVMATRIDDGDEWQEDGDQWQENVRNAIGALRRHQHAKLSLQLAKRSLQHVKLMRAERHTCADLLLRPRRTHAMELIGDPSDC